MLGPSKDWLSGKILKIEMLLFAIWPYDTSDSLYIILRSSFDLPLPYLYILYIIISVITPKSEPSNPDLLEAIWNRSVAVMYFFLPGHHFLLEVKFDPIDEGVQIQIGPSRPYWVIHYGCSANGETGQKLTQVFARLCMTIYYKHYTINIMTKHVDITLPILILEPTLEHPVGGINIVEPMTWG